jgi:hypothetical protein
MGGFKIVGALTKYVEPNRMKPLCRNRTVVADYCLRTVVIDCYLLFGTVVVDVADDTELPTT